MIWAWAIYRAKGLRQGDFRADSAVGMSWPPKYVCGGVQDAGHGAGHMTDARLSGQTFLGVGEIKGGCSGVGIDLPNGAGEEVLCDVEAGH